MTSGITPRLSRGKAGRSLVAILPIHRLRAPGSPLGTKETFLAAVRCHNTRLQNTRSSRALQNRPGLPQKHVILGFRKTHLRTRGVCRPSTDRRPVRRQRIAVAPPASPLTACSALPVPAPQPAASNAASTYCQHGAPTVLRLKDSLMPKGLPDLPRPPAVYM